MKKKILQKIVDDVANVIIHEVEEDVRKAIDMGLGPIEISENGINKGLEIVGARYERGEYFLSDLIMSAEIANRILKILEVEISSESKKRSQGKIVIGTVHGDLHDIGKNLVIALLKATGFEVYDIGIDISSEKFVEAVKKYNPDVLGMSALLTSCIPEFEKTIEALEVAGLRSNIKVIIGGRAASEKIAKNSGADEYAKNAWEGTKKVTDFFT
jgi:5-methyltetrahydrofolate--homocysteine methyltransferase